nr:PadR family transcriptional regulator [Bacillus sp. FJAT-50079]
MQIAILHLLKEESMHGYRIMKELEERAEGFYSASAGTVYPALQEMVERDLIALESKEDKKIYFIKENGIGRLEEYSKKSEGDFWSEWKARWVWQSSEEAIQLKNVIDAWDIELKKAIKEVRRNPENSAKLIAFMEETIKRLQKENR